MLLAYGESGISISSGSSSSDDMLPSILKALHGSGIGQHEHIHVRMKYFEICAKYAKILSSSDNETMTLLQTVVGCMLGGHGMRCSDEFVRARTVYFFLKLVEGLESNAVLMLPYVGSFAGKLFVITLINIVLVLYCIFSLVYFSFYFEKI